MSLKTVDGKGAPCIARNFAASVAAVLHEADAPAGCYHLPAGVMFNAAGNFNWTDATGTDITTVVTEESAGTFCPLAPAQLQVDNAVACTVFWHRGATGLR